MPPVNTQGSRAGLITATVIFTILFVTAAVLAIYFNVQLRQMDKDFVDYKKIYNNVVPDTFLNTQQFTSLKDQQAGSQDSIIELALKQRDQATNLINGSTDTKAATDAAQTTLDDATKRLQPLGITLPQRNLTGDVSALVASVLDRQTQIEQMKDQVKQKQADLDAAIKKAGEQQATWDKAMADARAQGAADLSKVNDQFGANKTTIDQMTKDVAESQKKVQDAAAALQTTIAAKDKQITKLEEEIARLKTKFTAHRVNVNNAAVRQGDGHIIRVASDNIVYVDLGAGDQVSPGLTMEVYDKLEGVPGIPENASDDAQLPEGKAAIEITQVGPVSSIARVTRIAPGVVLSEGDVVANLVYDKNTKYNFYVFGNFDLARAGRPNAADTEVVKRLITQWGGKVADQLNVDTDFVVLGHEPELPNFSAEELAQPLNKQKLDKAQADKDKYEEIRQTAVDLHIPILNQNRFLYYVGYYDQAKR